MKQDLYAALGVQSSATEDEIKKAFRKLAMEHHPDREGGNEAKFKEINTAYETLSDPQKKRVYDAKGVGNQFNDGFGGMHGMGNMDEFMRAFVEAQAEAQRNAIQMVTIRVPIMTAFTGGTVPINVYGHSVAYKVRPSLPTGVSYVDEIPIGDGFKRLQVQLLIDTKEFAFRYAGPQYDGTFSGDLDAEIKIDALDLILGAWITVTDFTGKQLQVRIPSGFEPEHRLKVAGHGYSNWKGEGAIGRGDIYLKVIPEFKAIKDQDPVKVRAFYDAVSFAMKDEKLVNVIIEPLAKD